MHLMSRHANARASTDDVQRCVNTRTCTSVHMSHHLKWQFFVVTAPTSSQASNVPPQSAHCETREVKNSSCSITDDKHDIKHNKHSTEDRNSNSTDSRHC